MAKECIQFEPALEAKLRRLRLQPELADQDTIILRNVRADDRCFSKASTNLLIKRAEQGAPYIVCVDQDLEYTGVDPALAREFSAALTRQGWRILTFGGRLRRDLAAALEFALEFLGADKEDGGEPAGAAAGPRGGLLAAWAENLTAAIAGRECPTLFRGDEIAQVAACTLSWQGRLPLILGGPGTGKTNLLFGIAHMLASRQRTVLAVNLGAMMAGALFESEREVLLRSLLREAGSSGSVIALEQAEWSVISSPRGHVLLREALDRGVGLVATSLPEHSDRFGIEPLGSRLEIVRLSELCAGDTRRVLETLLPSLAAHHNVRIDVEVAHAAVERSLSMQGLLPGKAVTLLDAAAARARLLGSDTVNLIDVYLAASGMQEMQEVDRP